MSLGEIARIQMKMRLQFRRAELEQPPWRMKEKK